MQHIHIIISIVMLILLVVIGIVLSILIKKQSENEDNVGDKTSVNLLQQQITDLKAENKELQNKNDNLNAENSSLRADLRNLNEKLTSQKEEMEKMQEKFKLEFENIATKIFKQNTDDFSKTSKENLGQILNPLKENIEKFEKSVKERAEKDDKQHATLYEKLKQLQDINQNIGKEAQNLAKALKGESKTQGNWGEFILTRILESSGLEKGVEYDKEVFAKTEDGKADIRPDVIIYLPDQKHLIIDSKVSLTAYEKYVNSDDETEKEQFLKEHLNSVRGHIKKLSEKDYSANPKFDSPDFTLLFMPVEPAFNLALQKDGDLFNFAWSKQIVIVCPSTLLATLKTVYSIWKQDKQNKNAKQIAVEAGNLYDKFVGFLEDMEKIDKSIMSSRNAYESAINKLQSGRGNLIGRVEKIKEMGANTSKALPPKFDPNKIEE